MNARQLAFRTAGYRSRTLDVEVTGENEPPVLWGQRAGKAQGWETTGVQFSDAGATVVILKRTKSPG
jgi:hypothetical protein